YHRRMHRLTHALALALAGSAGLLLPMLLVGADAPSVLVVATLAAAVAAMVLLAGSTVLVPSFAALHIDETDGPTEATRPGRVTDPVHHPIRRRAPGRR
ncbi:MAG: hypothetical protein ABIO16_17240, partial [Nocardioides sp.]